MWQGSFRFFILFSVCHTTGPLGMITGAIQDWQISASSAYPNEWDRKCREKYARVYLENKYGWCAKYKSASEWLQVDLGVSSRVSSDVICSLDLHNISFLTEKLVCHVAKNNEV